MTEQFFVMKPSQKVTLKTVLGQNKGQLVVEYVLLLAIAVMIAATLQSALVGRSEGNTGIIINKWGQLLELVGNDLGD